MRIHSAHNHNTKPGKADTVSPRELRHRAITVGALALAATGLAFGTGVAAASGSSPSPSPAVAVCATPVSITVDRYGNATGNTSDFVYRITQAYVSSPHYDVLVGLDKNGPPGTVTSVTGTNSDNTTWVGSKGSSGVYHYGPPATHGVYITSINAIGCRTAPTPTPTPTSTSPSTTTSPSAGAAKPTIHPGRTQTVTGTGFAAHEKVKAVLHSTAYSLGTRTASATGRVTFTFTLPSGISTGRHHVTLTGETSGRIARADFSVEAGTSTTTTTSGNLASTGTNHLTGLTIGGITALLVGAGMLLLGGRVRTQRHH